MAEATTPSSWQAYDSYDVPVDPKQGDRALAIRLHSFRRPHMRAFHFAWFGFFMAFVSWFAFAPLMPEVKSDLGLTKNQVYEANISSVSSTILARFIVGPMCDTYGARQMSSLLLIAGAIPTYFGGLVETAEGLAIIRFFIGVLGATFVCTQFWSAQIFAKEIVGTANATTAGWGNLGGGVTQIFMVGLWTGFKQRMSSENAWRISFVVPATIVLMVGILQLLISDDCPKGNYKDLVKHGAMVRKSTKTSFNKGYVNVNSWIMFVHYACCFGVELTMNNTAATYFHDDFNLSTAKAGLIASLFGLMNLFARSLGGIWSDTLNRKFGGSVTGMRGRFYAHMFALLLEGSMLVLFSQANDLTLAVILLVCFSLGTQMAEGTSYGIVPYIVPDATGAVSGIVGAGGNFGAVMWGLVFRFGPDSAADVYLILGFAVFAVALTTPLLRIKGYDSILGKAQGEADSIEQI